MASKHTAIMKLAQMEATRKGWRLFVNFVGGLWLGRSIDERKTSAGLHVVLHNAKFLRVGLTPGSFDLVGWRPLVVTPDMVGHTIAQFTTVDAKTKGYKRLSSEQLIWARAVKNAGGFVGMAMEVPEKPGTVIISETGEE